MIEKPGDRNKLGVSQESTRVPADAQNHLHSSTPNLHSTDRASRWPTRIPIGRRRRFRSLWECFRPHVVDRRDSDRIKGEKIADPKSSKVRRPPAVDVLAVLVGSTRTEQGQRHSSETKTSPWTMPILCNAPKSSTISPLNNRQFSPSLSIVTYCSSLFKSSQLTLSPFSKMSGATVPRPGEYSW